MSLLIEALKQAEARKGIKPGKPGKDKPEAPADAAATEVPVPATSTAAGEAPADSGSLELSLAPREDSAPASEPAAPAEQAPEPVPEPQPPAPAAPAPSATPTASDPAAAAPAAMPAPAAAAAPTPAPAPAPRPAPAAAPSAAPATASGPASRSAPAGNSGRLQTGSDAARRVAREVMAAAQQHSPPGRTRQRLLLGSLVLVALLMSAGGWWLSRSDSGLGGPPMAPVSPEALAAAEAEAEADAGSVTTVLHESGDSGLDGTHALHDRTPLPAAAGPEADAIETGAGGSGSLPAEGPTAATADGHSDPGPVAAQPAAVSAAPTPALQPSSTLRIERARQAQQPLQEGYAALNRGELDSARRAYQLALQSHPGHPDALLGLAVIAERGGDLSTAARRYREVLKVEPRNPIALSALLGSGQGSAGVRSESQLREALAAQPRSPALHFALGNVLAGGERWAEAQQSYFEAAALAPDDPDMVFNLGVALDRLHKPRLALEHYLRAETLRRSRPAAYDPHALARRITTLSRQLPAAEGTLR